MTKVSAGAGGQGGLQGSKDLPARRGKGGVGGEDEIPPVFQGASPGKVARVFRPSSTGWPVVSR